MMTTSNESRGSGEVVDVALAHAAMLEAGAIEPRARERQHVERQIEAEAALDIGGEQFEHAPGAGAEVEQRADRLSASAARIASSTAASATCSLRMRSHSAAWRRK